MTPKFKKMFWPAAPMPKKTKEVVRKDTQTSDKDLQEKVPIFSYKEPEIWTRKD